MNKKSDLQIYNLYFFKPSEKFAEKLKHKIFSSKQRWI